MKIRNPNPEIRNVWPGIEKTKVSFLEVLGFWSNDSFRIYRHV